MCSRGSHTLGHLSLTWPLKNAFRNTLRSLGVFLSMSNPISLHGPAKNFSLLQKSMFWFVDLTVCQVHKYAFGNNHSNPHTTPRPLFLFPWFQMTNSFLLRYSDYVPFPLERSSSVRANVKLRGRVAQITANK